MAKCFRHAEVFPVIAESIQKIFKETQDWVTHDQLVGALMAHPETKNLIDTAPGRGCSLSDEHLAANMVAWFSARFEAKTNEYQNAFEPTKVAGKYAFKPKR